MLSARRLFGFLATGVVPEMSALDAAIERDEARRNISDVLMDEMLAFLRGGAPEKVKVRGEGEQRKGSSSSVAEDEQPASLKEHDAQYHPDGYKEGDSCKFREKLANGDKADSEVKAEGEGEQRKGSSFLSNKKRREYETLMKRKHPEMDADALLVELGKIGDRKVQGDAFRWVMKHAILLPDGLPMVELARQLADKAKVDPLQYDTPKACIDDLQGKVKVKDKPIDPDTVPELSDKQVLPMCVTTYEVQDDRKGQQAMREIINTHWGKDANPWCLLHGDGEGNLSDGTGGGYDAAYYWEHYSALPKRVAFKDGKLLAFMADEEIEEPDEDILYDILYEEYGDEWEADGKKNSIYDFVRYEHEDEYYDLERKALEETNDKQPGEKWWDRQDRDHEGIPLGYQPVQDDEFGRWGWFEVRDGKARHIGGFRKGDPGTAGATEWYHSGGLLSYTDGHMTYVWSSDGALERVMSNSGESKYEFNPDGTFAGYYRNYQKMPDPSPDVQKKILETAKRMRDEHTVRK